LGGEAVANADRFLSGGGEIIRRHRARRSPFDPMTCSEMDVLRLDAWTPTVMSRRL
jgi:hypothetical protein